MGDTDRLVLQIGIIGGTGKEGTGLAFRWAQAGYDVIIGSRDGAKAEKTARELNEALGSDLVRGMINAQVAGQADIIVVTIPYSAHRATLEQIAEQAQGKIVVDVTVPIVPPAVSTVTLPPGRTAAEEAQSLLGGGVRVVSAFQNVSSVHLKDAEATVLCDVLVCADDESARQETIALAEAAGLRGIDAGPLANAIVAESLTPVLLGINKRYGVKSAGIRITGIDNVDG